MIRPCLVAVLSLMFVIPPEVAQAHPFGGVAPPLRLMAPASDAARPPPPPQPGSPAAEAAAQAQPQPPPQGYPPQGYPPQGYQGPPPQGYPPQGQPPPQGYPYPYYYPYPYPPPPPPKSDDDEDDDDDDDDDERTPGKGMAIGGFATFGVSYLTFALTTGLIYETGLGAIPIGGPFIFVAEDVELAPLWVFAGLAQVAGLAMGIAGSVRVHRYNNDCRLSRDGLRLRGNLHLDSKARRNGAGLDLTYRF